MVTFDYFSISAITAIVVIVCGTLFLIDTMLRKDSGAGRIWSLAFLCGMLTVACYLIWAAVPESWIAVALGNGALVGSAGFLWLGCRSYNARRLRPAAIVILVGALAALTAAAAAGPDGGDWAGAMVMFVGIAVFAGLGAVESRRGAIGRTPTAVGLTVVLVVECGFYILRAVFFLVEGEDGVIFTGWLGLVTTAILTTVLTIVSVVTTSVLRAGQSQFIGESATAMLAVTPDGYLRGGSFATVLEGVVRRAESGGELIGVISLRADDLPQIGIAFGIEEEQQLTGVLRHGVRAYAPNLALVGESGPTTIHVGFQPASVGDARRIASRIHRRVLDDLAAIRPAVIPVLGVGVALSDTTGYNLRELRAAADESAHLSASSPDASVMIADSV